MPDDGAAPEGAMTATRATRHRAIYLRETIHSKLRLVRTLSDTRVYESYAPRSASTIGMTMTVLL